MWTYRFYRRRKENQSKTNEANGAPSYVPSMAKKVYKRELLAEHRLNHAKSTLICIYICGGCLICLGIALTVVGAVTIKTLPNPYVIIGSSLIVVGIFILLMSIEIILKNRKMAENESDDSSSNAKKKNKPEWSKAPPYVPDCGDKVRASSVESSGVPEVSSEMNIGDTNGGNLSKSEVCMAESQNVVHASTTTLLVAEYPNSAEDNPQIATETV